MLKNNSVDRLLFRTPLRSSLHIRSIIHFTPFSTPPEMFSPFGPAAKSDGSSSSFYLSGPPPANSCLASAFREVDRNSKSQEGHQTARPDGQTRNQSAQASIMICTHHVLS